jgi:hypothetical protein
VTLFRTLHDRSLNQGEVTSTTEDIMERDQALKILSALANGVHPMTGEIFAADSPYQQADTVRALFEAVRTMEGTRQTSAANPERKTADVPGNTFVRWTSDEEDRLATGFDAGKDSAELAKLHNRSRAAIEARLLKLGKIDVSGLTVQLRYLPKLADGAHAQDS